MTDQTVGVINQSGVGTLKVDVSELTVNAQTVERQRMVIADPVGAGLFANVTAGGALKVDASATTQPVSGAFFQATQPVSAASLPLPTGAATSALQTTINTTLGSPFQAGGSIGNTGFNATQSGTWTVQPGNTANTTAWKVDGSAVTQPVSVAASVAVTGTFWQATQPVSLASLPALASGGALIGAVNINGKTTGSLSTARMSTGASGVIKAGAGNVYAYDFLNTNAAVRYLQLYNKTTAGVPGTDTPVAVIGLPAGGSKTLANPLGMSFATGIAWAITTDAPGVTIAASGDIVGTALYF